MYLKMKKLTLLLFVFIISFISLVNANFVDVQVQNWLSCDDGTVSIYLNEDNDGDWFFDKDIYLNSNFEYSENDHPPFHAVHIRNDLSKVQYRIPESNMLYSIKNGVLSSFDNTLFNRASLVFPYNQWVRGIDSYPNKVAFEQPQNNLSNNSVVLNYHYIYKLSNGFSWNSNHSYWYNQPSNYLDHSNNVTYCTLWSTPAPCSSSWSYNERTWFSELYTQDTCTNFELYWCGDWTLQSSSQNFDFWDSVEQCDPNDPTQEGWWDLWCSSSCEPINQWLVAPTCDIEVLDMNNGSYNVDWVITWTFDIPALLNITPSTVNFSNHNITTNIWTITNILPSWYGTYTATLTVENDAGFNTCTDTFYVEQPQWSYCGDWDIDWPNDDGINEECDDWNSINWDGCDSNCKLSVPSCELVVNPNIQTLWSNVVFSANTNQWARYYSFDLDDGNILYTWDIYFNYSYIYNTFGFFDPLLTVENDYNPIYMGVEVERPTNICGTSLDILEPEVDLDIEKILITTGKLLPGDEVEYRIELTNNGDVLYNDAYIIDELPSSLELTYHDISGVYPYSSDVWQDVYGNWIVEYSWFDLNPGQTAILIIKADIREWASPNETLNCAFTYNDLDCEMYFLAPDPYILKSQMMSNWTFSTLFTTGNLSVSPGDYITYRIDFANVWWWNTSWVLLRDRMPLCVDYVSASINWVSSTDFVQYQDINGRWILEYSNFDLINWQAWYMIVTGQIMNWGVCDLTDSYTNDSYIHFYDPLLIRQSSVTATKTEQSIVNITKNSDIDNHMIWDDKLFVIKVENFGPNPISDIVLEDIRPGGTCINYVSWTGVWFTKDPLSLEWNYPGTLIPGDSITLYISWAILDNPACENPDYQNIINLKYTELWEEYTDQDIYHFSVSATPIPNISIIKTADKNLVYSWSEITYTITYQNIGDATINNYTITDYWPVMVDFVSASPFPSSVSNFVTGTLLKWNFYTPLMPGQTWEIILEWVVN